MTNILRFAAARLSTDKFDYKLAEYVSYVVGIMVLALGILKLSSLHLSEGMLVIGIFAVLATSMTFILLGMVNHLIAAVKEQKF